MSNFLGRLTFANGRTIELRGSADITADITKESTEAIVNAANSSLLGGGGVDGAIHRAGGPAILDECRRIVARIGRLDAGKAVITTGGRLPSKYVIHTVGPVYGGGRQREAEILANCYRESIRIADDHGIRSIAFPSISTGHSAIRCTRRREWPSAIIEALPSCSLLEHTRFALFDIAICKAYVRAAEQLSLPPNNTATVTFEKGDS